MKRAQRRIVLAVVSAGFLLLAGVTIGLLREELLAMWFLRQLDAPEAATRWNAVDRLGELGALGALPRLLAWPPADADRAEITGAGRERRTRALESIVSRSGTQSLAALRAAIDDPSTQDRELALRLLQQLPRAALAPATASVGRLLADEDGTVVASALSALGHAGEHASGAVPHLLRYYARELPEDADDAWGDLRENAQAMRIVYPPPNVTGGKVVGILFAVARRDADLVACALAEAGWPAARAILREALGQQRFDIVLGALRCPDAVARRYAATILGDLEAWDERVIRALEEARANDSDPRVRELAALALATVGGR